MTDIEDRLRADLQAFAQRAQPGSIRPLRAPAPRRKARTARWLAPVAAAVAVVAVVAGVTLASRSMSHRPAPAGALSGVPRYYVTLVQAQVPANSHGHVGDTETANVYDSATGRLLDKVPVPDGAIFPGHSGIAAAADDRLFAINNDGGIFLLRLSANGRSARLQNLPIRRGPLLGLSPALSPDGSELALMAERCGNGGCRFGVQVVPVARPATAKVWLGPRMPVDDLSWSADGQQVMFDVPAGAGTAQYRLLNVASPAGNLLTESRPVNVPAALSTQMALLTPDGRAVVGSTMQVGPGRNVVTGKIVEVSRRTGRLLRVLMVATAPPVTNALSTAGGVHWTTKGDCSVLSMAPSGVRPLVICFERFGWIEGGRFTPLPGWPGTTASHMGWAAAW